MEYLDRLKFCKICNHKQNNLVEGLVCSLTNKKPTFERNCENFSKNEEFVKEVVERKVTSNVVDNGIRFVHHIVDAIFSYITIFIWSILISMITGNKFLILMENGIFSFVVSVMFMSSYYIFFEGLFRRTPAKFLTKTIVVNETGGKPEFTQIIIRSFARFIPFEAFSFLGDGPGWHDTLSNTRVIKIEKTIHVNSEEE